MKKLKIHAAKYMNLVKYLLDNYGVHIKARNYFNDEPPDPYFIFDHEPSREVMDFIVDYFRNEGGVAEFSDDGKKFIVYENNKCKK